MRLTRLEGTLTGLTKQVRRTAVAVEIAEHLGYDRGDPSGQGSGNSRNGTRPNTVRTDTGEIGLDVHPPGSGGLNRPGLLGSF
jgi:transposase-like protein